MFVGVGASSTKAYISLKADIRRVRRMPLSSEVRLQVNLPSRSIDYLARAERLRKKEEAESLMYAALELRCGVEARMREYTNHAIGISRAKAQEWEIKKLGRTLETVYGTGDTMLVIRISLSSGLAGQFIYAPVSSRLQEIAKKIGAFLHAGGMDFDSVEQWSELRAILHEGCGLLQLCCAGEVLRPSFSDGLHFALAPGDPRVQLVREIQNGAEPTISIVNITPAGPISYYPVSES